MSDLRLKIPQAGEFATANNFDTGGNVGDVLTKLAPPAPGQPPDYGWRPGGGGIPAPTISAQVFVSALYGSDVTGNGTQAKPYATIAHAQSTILDAASTKVYQIWVMPGVYTEAVGLMAWTVLTGTDMSDNSTAFMQANVIGAFTLGPSFTGAILGEQAWVTNIDVNGSLTLDYVAAGSTNGSIVFTNSQIEGNAICTGGSSNTTEFHNCNQFGDFTEVGGFVEFHNTNNVNPTALLTVQGTGAAGSAFLDAWGGSWSGSVTLDQNASNGTVVLRGRSFDMSNGNVNVLASATHSPAFVVDHGDLPENCNISGAAGVMSPQMRISHQFANIAPNPTAIAGMAAGPPAGPPFAAVTTISLPYPAQLFGATPIENCHVSAAPVGANWGTFIGPHNCSVTVTYRTNGGVPTVDVNISNPGAAFNITDAIDLNVQAYLPLVL